ncbi:MAG: YwaF family protein [Clostridia bacterium]|nr:YwaF family protein [Clostridia bacterium]
MAKFIEFLDLSMPKPGLYGWYHIMWLAIVAISIVLLCKFFKEGTEKQVNTIIHTVAIAVFILEIYKQVNFTFTVENGIISADYSWYAFPFQFCDMPMYVGLLTIFFRKGKVHDALCAFLGTYAIFAGICVMLYPGDVFIETIGINIQTMICHGGMLVVGVYLLYTQYVKNSYKTLLKALPVFVCGIVIATILNEIAAASGILENETFNMFYISRHCAPHLPVYSLVQQVVPYPWCLFIYILGFTAAAGIIISIPIAIRKINKLINAK